MNISQISVVVSGPVIKTKWKGRMINATEMCLKSIRKKMPDAEIIFSTWPDEDLSELDFDVLVQSSDPGGGEEKDGGNINRQICSRRAGILKASRPFVLAMRSESFIQNLNFLNYWDRYNKYSLDNEWKFLNKRVIIPAAMPASRALLFHMGDWYYFGQKEDVLDVWDIPYWKKGSRNNESDDLMYNAHRYVITAFARKHHDLCFEKKKDVNEKNRIIYEKIIANNFVIVGFQEYGIDSYKYYYKKTIKWHIQQAKINYYHSEWIGLYNKYCNGQENASLKLTQTMTLKLVLPLISVSGKIKKYIKEKLKSKDS